MKAAVICFLIGVASSVAGTVTLNIPGVGLGVFALLFSVGNLCSLLSVTFLIGPKNQILTMCAKERAFATFLLLWDNSVASLVFCILQFLAFLWYLLSYVPYARTGVSKACSSICC
uniref:Vesicle transport protein n=1 Tax=Knipowitschia caucasica TaxID=637954 RepID=A0AAV2LEJ9_KNICA